MISLSDIYPGEWGHNQYITEAYGVAFSDPYPEPEGQLGYDFSAYIPTASIVYTTYYFNHWEDNSTNLTRVVIIESNDELMASYVLTPGGSQIPSLPIAGYPIFQLSPHSRLVM
jgi:hypothetical protein